MAAVLMVLGGWSCVGSVPEAGVADDEDIPLIDAVPTDGMLPPADDGKGFSEYRLPDGRHVVVVSAEPASAPAPAEDGDGVQASEQALSSSVAPVADTWVRRTPAGAVDFGKSCELRVNNIITAPNSEQNMALLRFTIPPVVSCGTIASASLVLKTAQMPNTGATLVVAPHRVTSAWVPGASGAAICSACYVTSGATAAIAPPTFTGPLNSFQSVNRPCTNYTWDITPMVVGGGGWCFNPGGNRGVLMGGINGVVTVNFNSNEAPNPADRPRLVIVY